MIVEPASGEGPKETLTESRLLLQYISDTYTNGEWVPTSPEDKKRDVFFQEFAKSTLQMKADFALIFDILPMFLPFGISYLARLMVSPLVNHFTNDLKDIYQYMEDNLSERKPWLAGEKFGLSDLVAIFGFDIAAQRKFGWDTKKYPRLAKWHQNVMERDSYQKALQKGGPYNLVTFE